MAAMTAGLSAILLHQVLPGSVLALASARVASAAGLLCSLGAVFMARYTQGHEGFVMTGYVVYAVIWACAAIQSWRQPGNVHATFATWLIGHAYATCRICVRSISASHLVSQKMSYTMGTLIASTCVLMMAFPRPVSMTLLAWYVCLPLVFGGLAAPLHVHNWSKASRQKFASFYPFAYYRAIV